MQILNLVIACILGAFGLGLTLALIWLPLRNSVTLFRGGLERSRFKRAASRLSRADQLIDAGDYVSAIQELRKAMIYDVVHSKNLITLIREHHQNLLSRLLIVAEHTGHDGENIGRLDHLIIQRTELLSLYLKAFDSFHRVSRSRETSGKGMPAWSKGEFDKKASDIRHELSENQKFLEAEMEKLFTQAKSPTTPSITYH